MGSEDNMKSFSMLFSYAYFRNSKKFKRVILGIADIARVMIDCGAFTDFHAEIKANRTGSTRKPGITLDEYIEACREWDKKVYGYIALDKIGDPVETRKRIARMFREGLSPMPVFTGNAPWADMKYFSTLTDHICIGGIWRTSSREVFYSNLNKARANAPKARFHLLGYARYPDVMALPITSYDASSFAAGQQYGRLTTFDPYNGLRSYAKNEHKLEYASILAKYKITPQLMRTGKWNGLRGFPAIATIHAHVLMQRQSLKTSGKFYFLAVPNTSFVEVVVATSCATKGDTFDYNEAMSYVDEMRAFAKDEKAYIKKICDYIQQCP
jgi:hypothetical protein